MFHNDFKVTYTENLPKALKLFSDFLGTKSWLVGENITYPDFHLYEMLDQHKMFKADCLKGFPNLEAYCDRYLFVGLWDFHEINIIFLFLRVQLYFINLKMYLKKSKKVLKQYISCTFLLQI